MVMRRQLLIFLALASSAQMCFALEEAPRSEEMLRLAPPTQAILKAKKEALFKLMIAQDGVQQAKATANPAALREAQNDLAIAKANAITAQNEAAQVPDPPVADEQWGKITTMLAAHKGRYEKSMHLYDNWALGLLIVGLALAAASTLAGLLKVKNGVIAGVVSFAIIVVGAITKATPINERAEYFRVLFYQSASLLDRAGLELTPTVSEYNEFVRKIDVLNEYETKKFPASANPATIVADLQKELESSGAARPG